MQAKDISEVELITWLNKTEIQKGYWVNAWDFVGTEWDEDHIPHNVLWAKLRKLIQRGLIDGCTCGCRGDFTVKPEGRRFIMPYAQRVKEFNTMLQGSVNVVAQKQHAARHAKKTPSIFNRVVEWFKRLW